MIDKLETKIEELSLENDWYAYELSNRGISPAVKLILKKRPSDFASLSEYELHLEKCLDVKTLTNGIYKNLFNDEIRKEELEFKFHNIVSTVADEFMNQTKQKEWIKSNSLNVIDNYAGVPGLKSHLITNPTGCGCIRLFENTREQVSYITPHTHRFDFKCVVLSGTVENITFTNDPDNGDLYSISELSYNGSPGDYDKRHLCDLNFTATVQKYGVLEEYAMKAHEFHSIKFSKGALVLFLEGGKKSSVNKILEPICDAERIDTFRVEPWMFKNVNQS